MPEMPVNRRTTLQQSQEVVSRPGADKVGDRGDGVFTLYTHTKGDGVGLKNFFGLLDARRQAAREAIGMVLRRAEDGGSQGGVSCGDG